MVINYCGEKCFKIQSGKLSIAVDPLPRFKGDITIYTEPSEFDFPAPENTVAGPGEYEMKEVEISGWPLKKSAAYLIKLEDIRLGVLGEAMETFDPGIVEKFGEVDILITDSGISAKAVKQIQPKIVIPFYKKPDQLKAFLKEMDKKAEVEEKLVIKKKELTPGMKIIPLKS